MVAVAITELVQRWSGSSPDTGTSRERRQLRRPQFLALGCAWIIALASGAGALALSFGWLFFGCAVLIVGIGLLERGVHLMSAWQEHGDRRRHR